ncbi:hypothetical protein Q5P01_025706 [Channa striata]|uniref:Lysozyme n=1 Tax=Channa striata TaxID=64152 RepID=A0AA88LHL1_CHASR|nr:hypothetical protein Q5P01_025706 [Channa striata]
MKLLVVLVLSVLGCSLTEGRIVTKCGLKTQLEKATTNLTAKTLPKGLTVDKLATKIVCHAEQVSGFNTSMVKEQVHRKERTNRDVQEEAIGEVHKHPGNHSEVHVEPTGEVHKHPGNHSEKPTGEVHKHPGNHSEVHVEPTGEVHKHPGNHSEVHVEPTGNHDKRNGKKEDHKNFTGSNQPHSRHRRHNKLPSLQARPAPPAPHPAENCTLYGIFQLSSCQVCSDGTTLSANICGMDCSKLVDDDVSDDIGCMLKILLSPGNKLLLKENCENKKAPTYFAGCSST